MKTDSRKQDLINTLRRVLSYQESFPIEVVESKAREVATIFDYQGSLNDVIERVWHEMDTQEVIGPSVVRHDVRHDTDWVASRADIEWRYSEAYRDYLDETGWSGKAVRLIQDSGDALLKLLHDPNQHQSFKTYGLVIGQVQSGKTANYTGLLCRAADAGYKLLIVIAGIQNALRSQTQQRLEATFAGRSTRTNKFIGVGLKDGFPHPAILTRVDSDFSATTRRILGFKLDDLTKPLLLVIKKNVTTLKNVHDWLQELNADQSKRIRSSPMLMIDDEADHASINTKDTDQDPTRTNEHIRRILELFTKAAYVGYTATPFANILIDDDESHQELGKSLFPRSFIHCLKAPDVYCGPDEIFPDSDQPSRYVLPITDCEDVIPIKHKKDYRLAGLPDSLIEAINQFVLARAIRILRGQADQHCSMLINVSRFVAVQKQVHSLVDSHVRDLQNSVQLNYRLAPEVADQQGAILFLRQTFERHYQDCKCDWEQVRGYLQSASENIAVLLVNVTSEDQLDYADYERAGTARTVIAIGGFSLSRGLTLEGLCVSYLYRNTQMYDTLMQMGRWFGYRPGYEDLCRIYLADEANSWYTFVARATREVHAQVQRMANEGRTPAEFGLWVRNHPDQLTVTARNKMLRGEKVSLDFGGRIAEFPVLPLDSTLNRSNEELIQETWSNADILETGKGWIARHVHPNRVITFLEAFDVPPSQRARKAAVIGYLRGWAILSKQCDVLLISPKNRGRRTPLTLGVQRRAEKPVINGEWRISNHRVAGRNDEKLGLAKHQLEEANAAAEKRGSREPIDKDYREARGIPVLMIHVIAGKKELSHERIPTIGVCFPSNPSVPAVEAVVNPVWLRAPESATWMREYEAEQVEE